MPTTPPEGYLFFGWNEGQQPGPNFGDPEVWGIDPEGPQAAQVVVVHEECGCLVMLDKITDHATWHASLVTT